MSDKQDKIIQHIKDLAKEWPYQTLVIQFEVHDHRLSAGKVLKQEKKLG